MTDFDSKIETKRLIVKLTIMGLGIDVIRRIVIWMGLDTKLVEMINELKNN